MDIRESCLFCEHFSFSLGAPGYSEMTPGCEGSVECDKGHFEMEHYDDVGVFRQTITMSATCGDFQEAKDA